MTEKKEPESPKKIAKSIETALQKEQAVFKSLQEALQGFSSVIDRENMHHTDGVSPVDRHTLEAALIAAKEWRYLENPVWRNKRDLGNVKSDVKKDVVKNLRKAGLIAQGVRFDDIQHMMHHALSKRDIAETVADVPLAGGPSDLPIYHGQPSVPSRYMTWEEAHTAIFRKVQQAFGLPPSKNPTCKEAVQDIMSALWVARDIMQTNGPPDPTKLLVVVTHLQMAGILQPDEINPHEFEHVQHTLEALFQLAGVESTVNELPKPKETSHTSPSSQKNRTRGRRDR